MESDSEHYNNDPPSQEPKNSNAEIVESCMNLTPALFDGTFFKLIPEKCVNRQIVATCTKCAPLKLTEIKGYEKTSSNFVTHLKRKHADAFEDYKKYKAENQKTRATKTAARDSTSSAPNLIDKGTQTMSDEEFEVETCKKRWKYLRERYVSQRKQGDPPVYEHLSRPYLEKMKFLDQHIQPRKSYRNVSSFLTSPNASSSFAEYNMDSSKSNGSLKNLSYPPHQQQPQQLQSTNFQQDGVIKTEADQTFRDFAAAVASQQLQQINTPQFNSTPLGAANNGGMPNMSQAVNSYDQYREPEHNPPHNLNGAPAVANGVASSTSSSMKSPLSSPQTVQPPVGSNNVSAELSDDHQFTPNNSNNMKKPRVQMTSQYLDTSDSDDNISPLHHSNMMSDNHPAHLHQSHQQQQLHHQQQQHQQQQQTYNKMLNNVARNMNSMSHTPSTPSGLYPPNNDFLFSLYQQMTPAAAVAHQERTSNPSSLGLTRTSEHLLGELVTSELLKMNKERRKVVQKRILEILFFED